MNRASKAAQRDFDVVIVGAGMTGTWAARELGWAGLRVALLDAGPLPSVENAANPDHWTREQRERLARDQGAQARHFCYWTHHPDLFVNDHDLPYSTPDAKPFVWIRGRQVGGRSHTWGGVTLRLSDYEFRGHPDLGPGCRWPIDHAELAPYYGIVERFMCVRGAHDGLRQLPDGCFVQQEAMTEWETRFKASVEDRWPTRRVVSGRGIHRQPSHRSAPVAGWSPHTTLHALLPDALSSGHVTLMADCVVSHLITNTAGNRVRAVACLDRLSGQPREVSGRVVLLCASTLESVRILLNSPVRGGGRVVGDSHGLVGKFLLDHASVSLRGTVPGTSIANAAPWNKGHGIVVPRFRHFEDATVGPGGYGMTGAIGRGMAGSEGPAQWALSSLVEVLPRRDNIAMLDGGRDAWGIGTLRIDFRYSDAEQTLVHDARGRMAEMVATANLEVTGGGETAPGEYVHELGGARMGLDPTESVVDPCNRVWDTRNLFVLDGACFPTSGWQNPSLTMMALAVRASHRVAKQLTKGDL